MPKTTIRFSEQQMQALDEMLAQGEARSRNALVQLAVQQMIDRRRFEKSVRICKSITLADLYLLLQSQQDQK